MLFKKPKSFIGEVKALNKGQIVDTQLIWRSFEGQNAQQNTSYFCLQLFENVLHSQKKSYLLQNQQRLYATLLCMQLYKNKKQKSTQLLNECRNFIQKKASSHGKGFMQFLFSSNRQDSLCQFFVSRLVMVPRQIDLNLNINDQLSKQINQVQQYLERLKQAHSHKNYEVLKKMCFQQNQTIQTKLLSFGYICLADHIKNNNNQIKKYEYQYMIKALKILVQGAQSINIIQQLIPLLIHLIKTCITFYGCYFQDLLKQLMMWANQLRYFPNLIGKLGSQLFNIIFQQLKIPGSAFRNKLRKDFLSLDIKQNIFFNKDIYFISDSQDSFSCHQDQSVSTLRKLIIIHILKIANIPQNQIKQFIKFVKLLNKQTSYIIYDKAIRILQVIQNMDNFTNIKKYLTQYITKLINQSVQKYANAKMDQQSMESQQFQILVNKINKFGHFQYPKYSVVDVPIKDFISNKENCFSLARIVQKNKADFSKKSQSKNKINLIFCGDGYNFIKFVQFIAQYQQKATKKSQLQSFQVYYIPKQEASFRPGIATSLSCKDAWFRKFIFNVYRQKMLYPHLQIKNNNKDLFPFYLYKRNIQLYLRQANYSMPFRVYKCKLKTKQFQTQQLVYMISFISMGLFCQAQYIKITKQKQRGKQERYYHKELIQIIQQKVKKIPIMQLRLQIQYLKPLSGTIEKKIQQNMRLEDLQICSIPHQYFMGKQPNPSDQFLQMSLLTETNGKIFRRQISHSDNFKTKQTKAQNYFNIKDSKSQNQVLNAFRDLFICQTIKTITIFNKEENNQLRIMIDGTYINKVEKITIQPAFISNGMPITIPIQCFLPIN